MAENRKDNSEIELEDNTLVLTDEDGEDIEFELLDLIEYEDRDFVVLLPKEGGEDDEEEVVILEVVPLDDDPDYDTYVSVEEEEVLAAVFDIFREKFKDEFDFED